jgi:PEP-CTERM motif
MKMKFAIAVASLALATTAQAAPIVVGQWYNFEFGGVGSALTAGGAAGVGINPVSISAPGGPWTFTLGTAGTLVVVDGFNSGDQFTMSDFGGGIGITSAPVTGAVCNNDITACLGNASFSKGTFALAAGNHSLTGVATLSPFGGGAGYFIVRVAQGAVPEPASWAMMLVGFGVVGGALRSRRNSLRVTMSMA